MKEPIKYYIWSIVWNCVEMWTLQKLDQKCLEYFEMRCWRRMEKINCTDLVTKDKVESNSVVTL
jgi:hypothetical protein